MKLSNFLLGIITISLLTAVVSGVPTTNFSSNITSGGLPLGIQFNDTTGANLLNVSQQYNSTTWTKVRSTVSADSVFAHDGTLTADTLIEDNTASNTHYVKQFVTLADNTPYIFSALVKAANRTSIRMSITAKSGGDYQIYFNVSSGTITDTDPDVISSIVPYGDDWYRCSISTNSRSGATPPYVQIYLSNGANAVFSGNSTANPVGVYLGGAQLEPGTVATAYKPTTTAAIPYPSAWSWDFGDGSALNTTQNPIHTYTTGGLYTVSLNATNSDGSNTSTKAGYIRVYNQTTAILSQNPLAKEGYVPPSHSVDYFGHTSLNVTNWSWWLDHEWYNSSDIVDSNVTMDYSDQTTHNWTIKLCTSDYGYGENCFDTYYNVTEGVSASFTGTPLTGNAPVSVQFTDSTGDGVDTWFWDFGDGNTTNNSLQNPLHTYATGGLFDVKLNASHSGSFDWQNRTGYVNLTSVLLPNPIFTANSTSGATPMAVLFTDATTNTPTMWNYSFGNGAWFNTTNSSLKNATYTYTLAGTYTVNLTASNLAGTNTTVRTAYIVATTLPSASFTINRPLVLIPQPITATSTSTNTPTLYNWSWGDNSWTNGTDAAPSHTYRMPGLRTIYLIASNAAGSNTSESTRVWVTGRRYGMTLGQPIRDLLDYNCNEMTYGTSRELSAIERLATDARIAALCS